MESLAFDPAPFTAELLPGISVTVRPASLDDMEICRAAARRIRDGILQGIDDCRAAGLATDQNFNPDDPDHVEGLFVAQLKRELAARHIIAWTGVKVGDGDEDAPPTPENIRAVFGQNYILADLFFAEVTDFYVKVIAAKKGYGAAPNGTTGTAAAPPTARDAKARALAAAKGGKDTAESDAPTSNTV